MSEQTIEVDSLELAKDAINYVLGQIKKNPNLRYHMEIIAQVKKEAA